MIGKKIYYELTTGTVILTIPENHSQNAINTTKEQDFIMFDVLQARNPIQIGMKQMAYKELQGNFDMATSYMIDKNNNQVLFQYPQYEVSQLKKIELLKLENDTLKAQMDSNQESSNLLGMQLVQKDMQIMELQNNNEALGEQIVQMDIRLMMGGM
jgi:hypothetical protein